MLAALIRLLKTEPARVGSVAATVYAAAVMAYRAFVEHTAVFDMDVVVAAVMAVYGLWTYLHVTPVARPRDAQGRPLLPL